MRRREYLRATGGVVAAGGLAGCGGDGDSGEPRGDDEVLVDPDGGNRFEPETLTVEVGETVTWRFERSGHNVSCNPDHHEDASLPDGATPFATYEDDALHRTVEEGATFDHTFEVPGEYVYVCIPHVTLGMVGTIVVEE